MNDISRDQDAASRIYGLAFALNELVGLLRKLNPDMPVWQIEALRDDLVQKFKNSGIPAEFEMQHVEIVGPAIDAIEAAFQPIIRDWGNADRS